ncbi:hypothetical protein SEUCBS140593_008682 [Sporothrix eucalyptigena]|uniref:Cupin 2 conserved barrel domain-containing protein n=1 Tax=Sporothrix eucalyptigena TaxID=1812306 RepID=A0ABP0CR55_9PEZI
MPLHSHPDVTKTTEMLDGVMEVYTVGKNLTVRLGESYSSELGVLHKGRNPGLCRSRFYWNLDPEPHIASVFEQTVMCIEQYLHEGLTGKDSMTGEPITAEEALKEAGIMIDKARGLPGNTQDPVRTKLFELFVTLSEQAKALPK